MTRHVRIPSHVSAIPILENPEDEVRRESTENNDQQFAHNRCRNHVFHADAEIIILGPDRMTFRLFRKRHGPKARTPAGE